MVAATPSGGWLQSSPIIPELGFCLSNRAQMFWLDDKSPASLAPKKRPRTTLSPSFAFKNDKPYMVLVHLVEINKINGLYIFFYVTFTLV